MFPDGLVERFGTAIVQIRPRVMESPERRRSPLMSLRSVRIISVDQGAIAPTGGQGLAHIVEQQVAVDSVNAAEIRRVAGGTPHLSKHATACFDRTSNFGSREIKCNRYRKIPDIRDHRAALGGRQI